VTYRIRRSNGPAGIVYEVSGEMDAEHASCLEALVEEEGGSILLDLNEVTVVAREAVRFLARAEERGVRIAHCPDYVRSWMAAEKNTTDSF